MVDCRTENECWYRLPANDRVYFPYTSTFLFDPVHEYTSVLEDTVLWSVYYIKNEQEKQKKKNQDMFVKHQCHFFENFDLDI